MKKHKTLIVMILIGIALTLLARENAVTRRISLGLTPSWGSEFFILPFILLLYLTLKADWSLE